MRANIGAFTVSIIREVSTPRKMMASVDDFFEDIYKRMIMSTNFKNKLTEAVSTLRVSLSRTKMSKEVDNIWEGILLGLPYHNLKEQQLKALGRVSTESFQLFYHTTFLCRTERKKLSIVIYGKGKQFFWNEQCEIDHKQIDQTSSDLNLSCKKFV